MASKDLNVLNIGTDFMIILWRFWIFQSTIIGLNFNLSSRKRVTSTLSHFFFYFVNNGRNKVTAFWNNKRVSKLWQNFQILLC